MTYSFQIKFWIDELNFWILPLHFKLNFLIRFSHLTLIMKILQVCYSLVTNYIIISLWIHYSKSKFCNFSIHFWVNTLKILVFANSLLLSNFPILIVQIGIVEIGIEEIGIVEVGIEMFSIEEIGIVVVGINLIYMKCILELKFLPKIWNLLLMKTKIEVTYLIKMPQTEAWTRATTLAGAFPQWALELFSEN